MCPQVWPGPRLTSVQSSVFSPVEVTPVWAAWPAATRPAWTGHGPGRSLLSPLLTSQHTHHHTPKDTKKNSKMSIPMTCGWERERSQSGGVEASCWPECDEAAWCEGGRGHITLHSQMSRASGQCPDPLMGQSSPGSPVLGTGSPRPRLSCPACHKVRVSSHLSHLSQLPRYTPPCQHWLITPGVTPGGRPGPDTRQTEFPAPGVTMILIRTRSLALIPGGSQ